MSSNELDNTETKTNWTKDLGWKILSFFLLLFITVLIFVVINYAFNNESSSTPETDTNTASVDFTFTGTDADVMYLCDLELQSLRIDYLDIQDYNINKTRVGTYELNGIIVTENSPSNPDGLTYTEMLCTIFPGDADPVELTFGKDW